MCNPLFSFTKMEHVVKIHCFAFFIVANLLDDTHLKPLVISSQAVWEKTLIPVVSSDIRTGSEQDFPMSLHSPIHWLV